MPDSSSQSTPTGPDTGGSGTGRTAPPRPEAAAASGSVAGPVADRGIRPGTDGANAAPTADPIGHRSRTFAMSVRYGLVLVIVVADQITKVAIDRSLELYERIPVTSFFNITKAYNPGAAFSFLSEAGGWQRWFFTIVSSVVSVVLIVWLHRMSVRERWLGIAIALILGGAVGNLIDRVIYGHVVDFIQVYHRDWYFPSFNVADSAISVGAAILIVLTLFDRPEEDVAP